MRALLQRFIVGLLLVLFLLPESYTSDLPALHDGTAELRSGDLPSGVPEFNDPHEEKTGLAAVPFAVIPAPLQCAPSSGRGQECIPLEQSPCQPRAPPLPV